MARGGPEVAVTAIFRTHGCGPVGQEALKRRSTALLRYRYSWTSTRNGLSVGQNDCLCSPRLMANAIGTRRHQSGMQPASSQHNSVPRAC